MICIERWLIWGWSSRTPLQVCFCFIFFFFQCFLFQFIFWQHHTAYEMLVPQPGIETGSTAVKTPSPNHWPTKEFSLVCSEKMWIEKRENMTRFKLLCLKYKQSVLKLFLPYVLDWDFNQDIWQWGNVCLTSCCLLVNIWPHVCWQSPAKVSFI